LKKAMPPVPPALSALIEKTLSFEYLDGAVTPLRDSHTTGMRILPYAVCAQISEGTTRLFFDDTGDFTLPAGHGFVAPEGVRHCSTLNSRSNISRWAHFRATLLDSVDALRFFTMPRVIPKTAAGKLGELCEAMAALSAAPWELTRIVQRKALGFQLFALIVENSQPHPDAPLLLDSIHRLFPLLQRLQAEPERLMSLGEMAREVHLSPSRFCALFRRCMGMPPVEYQRAVRLNAAKVLLLDSEKSIEQIACELGFEDPFHFSKSFKKNSGMNPRRYRAELRQGMWRG
jgi:AraC-like DNA-binding protein